MEETTLAQARAALEAMQGALDAEEAREAGDATFVEYDKCAVGRLSQMDALQGKAMAEATKARRANARKRIAAAFARMDAGEFGYCTECGEEIAPKRLELDPTIATCIHCARM